jgi:hypothetical protein
VGPDLPLEGLSEGELPILPMLGSGTDNRALQEICPSTSPNTWR